MSFCVLSTVWLQCVQWTMNKQRDSAILFNSIQPVLFEPSTYRTAFISALLRLLVVTKNPNTEEVTNLLSTIRIVHPDSTSMRLGETRINTTLVFIYRQFIHYTAAAIHSTIYLFLVMNLTAHIWSTQCRSVDRFHAAAYGSGVIIIIT